MRPIVLNHLIYTMVDLYALELAAKGLSATWQADKFHNSLLQLRRQLEILDLETSKIAADKLIAVMEEGYRRANELHARKSIFVKWMEGNNRRFAGDADEAGKLAAILRETVTSELGQMCIVAIDPDFHDYLYNKTQVFGSEVEEKMPDAVYDLREAVRCFALERYTACACHLMRSIELGVQLFGTKLGVPLFDKHNREQTWHNLLESIDAVLRKMPRDDTSKKYSAISANLYNVKVAWRNDTMHPNQRYDREQAMQILNASRAFLRDLSTVL